MVADIERPRFSKSLDPPRESVWKINIYILTSFLEYSRIQDGRLKMLSCEIYHPEC